MTNVVWKRLKHHEQLENIKIRNNIKTVLNHPRNNEINKKYKSREQKQKWNYSIMEGPCLKYAAEYECLAAPCNCIYYCLFAVINHTCVRILFALSLLLASKIHTKHMPRNGIHILR